MADFTPITTQDQFDAAIGERLKRERETLAKKYSDYEDLKTKVADYEKQIGQLTRDAAGAAKKYAGYDKDLADLQAKVKGYETDSVKTRIAHETGLPYELAGRLTGEDEAAIRKDAEALSKLLGGQPHKAPPLRSTEPTPASGVEAARKELLNNLVPEH